MEGCEVEFWGDIAEHGDEFLELVAEVKVVDDAEVDEFEWKAFWDDLVEGEGEGFFEAAFEDLDGDIDLDLVAEHEALFAEGVGDGGAVLAFKEDFGGAVKSGVEEGDLGLTELRDAVAEGVGKGPSADEDLASDLEGVGLLLEGFFELKFFGDGFELWGLELSEAFEDGGEDDLEEEGIATPLEASFFVGVEAAEVGLSRRAGGDSFLDHELALAGELVEEGHGIEGKFGEEPDMEFVVGALLAGGKEGRGNSGEVGSAFGRGGEVGSAFGRGGEVGSAFGRGGERGEVIGGGGFKEVFDRAEGGDLSGVEVVGGVFVGVLQFGAVEGFAKESGGGEEGVVVESGIGRGTLVGGDVFKVIKEVVLGELFFMLRESIGGDGAGDGGICLGKRVVLR